MALKDKLKILVGKTKKRIEPPTESIQRMRASAEAARQVSAQIKEQRAR